MPRRLRVPLPLLDAYVLAVVVAGGACGAGLILAGRPPLHGAPLAELALFGLCLLVAELVPLRVLARGREGELTASACFALAMLLAGGPIVALVGLVAANLIADVGRGRPGRKLAFNIGQYAISLAAAGAVLTVTTALPRAHAPHLVPADLPGVLAAALVFFLVNSALVAAAVALEDGAPVVRGVLGEITREGTRTGPLLALAPVIVVAGDFSPWALALIFTPLIAVHLGGREAIEKEHQALHDALTGLPNRQLLHDRIGQALRASRRSGEAAVVMLMDLDHFKEVNDTLGHHHGDLLLAEVGRRLDATLRGSDTVARLGGDEFAVLLPRVARAGDGAVVAQQILAALRAPVTIGELTLEIDASIGIAVHPTHGEDTETLLQRADIAMYAAKQSGRGYALFEPDLDHHSPRRLAIAGGLRGALERGEIGLHYQPQADVRTGRIVAVEALVRWEHPRYGLIGPSEFVPVAEQTGLIVPLTSHVLRTALHQLAQWDRDGLELSVAVNLSARSFLDTQLAVEIPRMLHQAGVDPARLELELTEGMLMVDPSRVQATLDRLSRVGLRLSVDDFGTGYSSLANLKRLPVDVIKIDKSFVIELAVDPSDVAIVRSTIELAHNLGLRVVAEGVESEAVLRRLGQLGCDLAQGYYLSRPLAPDALARFIRARESLSSASALADE